MTALAGTGAGTTTHRHPPIAAVKTPHHHHTTAQFHPSTNHKTLVLGRLVQHLLNVRFVFFFLPVQIRLIRQHQFLFAVQTSLFQQFSFFNGLFLQLNQQQQQQQTNKPQQVSQSDQNPTTPTPPLPTLTFINRLIFPAKSSSKSLIACNCTVVFSFNN